MAVSRHSQHVWLGDLPTCAHGGQRAVNSTCSYLFLPTLFAQFCCKYPAEVEAEVRMLRAPRNPSATRQRCARGTFSLSSWKPVQEIEYHNLTDFDFPYCVLALELSVE